MNDDENEDIESGLDVLKDTVGDIVDEDTESPLGQVMADAAERPTVESRPFRGMLVKELEEAGKRLMAKPAAPSSPLDRLIERFNVPTGKSGDLFAARQQREQERAKTDAERRKELMNVLAKLEETESQGILERQREETARQKALQGSGETTRTRSLREEAALRGITVEELLIQRDEERKAGKEEPISLSDVTAVSRDVRAVLDPSRSILTNVGTAKQQLKLVKEEGSASAEAQLDRFLAAAVGDRQLSQLEINAVASAGSFPSRVISGLNKFFSGTSGPLKLEEKEAILDALENFHGERFNSSRKRLIDAYSGLLPEERLMSLVDGRYITPSEKKAAQGGGAQQPPQGAIDMLKANPALAAEFDEKYGVGASKRYLGE